MRTLVRLVMIVAITFVTIGVLVLAVDHGAGTAILDSAGRGGLERFEGRGPEGQEGRAPREGVPRGDRGTRPEGGRGPGEGDRGLGEGGEGFGRSSFGWNELWDAARQMAVIAAVVIVLSSIWRPISRRLRKRRQRRANPGPAGA